MDPATQQQQLPQPQQQPSFTQRKTALQPNPRLLALAPLNPPNHEDHTYPPYTSYIHRRSVPSTPTLLSNSPPPFTRGVSAPYSLAQAARTKSKKPSTPSSTSRRNSKRPGHRRSKTTENSPTTPRPFQSSSSSFFPDTDFLLRVGAVIASEARDAKGQGWLATRDSSAASTPGVGVSDYEYTYPAYRPDEETLAARRRVEEQQRLRAARRSLQASRRGSRDLGKLNGLANDHGHGHGLSEELTMSLAGLSLTGPGSARSASQATFPGRWPGGSDRTSRPMTPMEERRAELLVLAEDDPAVREDYFNSRAIAAANAANAAAAAAAAAHEASLRPQPDFIGLDERLEFPERFAPPKREEEEEEYSEDEEEYLRAYMKDKGVLGRLFDYFIGREDDDDDAYADDEEDFEEDDDDTVNNDEANNEADGEADRNGKRRGRSGGDNEGWYDVTADAEAERKRQTRRSASWRRLQEYTVIPLDCTNDPPPREGEKGGVVSDAVWFVRVAAKAMFW
ncbi:hypothetical protein B0J18DRAFT_411135 [Chaetomium sp. MPI-SDFR-AT-0129]|nr:hypothetical protein B0J18DRAFT_411135 [Chaetomium sp. MPI-SDFR-AT-0129]